MTGRMMSGLTVATMLTILFLPDLGVARFIVERAAAPNPPASVAAEANKVTTLRERDEQP